MADDRCDVGIGDKLFGGGNRLGGTALIIELQEFQPVTGKDRSLRIGLFNGQLGSVQHILALRSLIAGQRTDEADPHHRLGPAAAVEPYREHNERERKPARR